MSSKILPVVSFVLVGAIAQAQPRPAPKPPQPPRPPAPVVAPFVPDLDVELGDLDVRLGELRAKLDLDLSPMLALDLEPVLAGMDAFEMMGQERWGGRAGDAESLQYSRGTEYLDQGRYEQALAAFDKAIAANGKRTDGALYWKAYCLNRLGRGREALSTLDDLLKKYPSSRWANDARALQVELRQASGRPVNPQQESDDELKLIALNGLIAREPDKAIPLVEQVLNGSASPRVKQRALFVLAQSGSPQAKTLLTDIAKGKGNPDLQLKALEYLGVFGGGPNVALLVDVYKGTSDADVKRRVIRSLAMAAGRGWAFNFVLPDLPNIKIPEIFIDTKAFKYDWSDADRAKMEAEWKAEAQRAREEAGRARAEAEKAMQEARATQRSTGSAERDKAREARAKEASDALWQLYQIETAPDLKREILRNMYTGDQPDRLLQIARTEKNADLRRAAIRGLMLNHSAKNADNLVALYRDERDPEVRRQIVDALGMMNTAGPLVQVARQETDPQLRKRIVERLSMMTDKEATDYLMELLKK